MATMQACYSITVLLYLACSVSSQSLATVLSLQTGLTQFTSYISQYPDLVAKLDAGIYTIQVLAPSDDAFSAYSAAGGNVKDTGAVRALLEYHILRDLHPSLSFDTTPQFLPSLLTNQSFTNVTGGQVVEIVGQSGNISIYTSIKARSQITIADTLYIGGLIHEIDRVLTIPISVPATITKAGLNDLIALLDLGGWLTNSASAETVIDMQDLSCFGTNSPQYSSSYTGFDGLDSASLSSVFEYALVAGPVAYSSALQNGTILKTLLGKDITVTILGNDTYVDASKVIVKDYITSNGVLQVLDRPLNPNTTDVRPTASAVPSSSGSGGLGSGSKSGIGVGVAVLIIALALLGGLYICSMRRKTPTNPGRQGQSLPNSPKELEGAKSFATELDASQADQRSDLESAGPAELDGRSTHRKSWFSQPRRTHVVELHSMFSIHASVRRLGSGDTNGS